MKPKDLTLPELKAGDLPKPEEKVKVDWNVWAEQEALLETEPEALLETEHEYQNKYLGELTETEPIPEPTAYHIPAHYKDLGELTQEEWQEVFGGTKAAVRRKNY